MKLYYISYVAEDGADGKPLNLSLLVEAPDRKDAVYLWRNYYHDFFPEDEEAAERWEPEMVYEVMPNGQRSVLSWNSEKCFPVLP